VAINYRKESSQLLYDFLMYHKNIQNHSAKTVQEYFLDLRTFFRYLIWLETDEALEFDEISIKNCNLEFAQKIGRSDIYDYLSWLSEERNGGLEASSRARKLASIHSFFKYLVVTMELLEKNPADGVTPPRLRKSLPKYLSETEANRLLSAVEGPFAERNYAILLVLMGCGLRVSELVSLNLGSIQDDSIRVLGKGNKERILYMPDSTREAVEDYMVVRKGIEPMPGHEQALFLSQRKTRLGVRMVQTMVDKCLLKAGLDVERYSPHKLRHTAATEMMKNGIDVRVVQEVLGHSRLDTTQIYTHVESTDLRIAAKANKIGKNK